jgi:hypothetical protein
VARGGKIGFKKDKKFSTIFRKRSLNILILNVFKKCLREEKTKIDLDLKALSKTPQN